MNAKLSPTTASKILPNYQAVKQVVAQYRQQNKTIVLTQGSFDMVHIGHGRYLEAASKHGDILIVGLDSDKKIQHRKGPDRPIVPEQERQEMLGYLSSVDHVVIKELNQPKWELIKIVKPDVLVATKQTYNSHQIEQLKKWCGKILILEPKATTSTSAKIRLIQMGMVKKIENLLEELKNA